MTKVYCDTEEEVEKLGRKTPAGYIGLGISLSREDIEHLLAGRYIYEVCNGEYGVSIEAAEKPAMAKRVDSCYSCPCSSYSGKYSGELGCNPIYPLR